MLKVPTGCLAHRYVYVIITWCTCSVWNCRKHCYQFSRKFRITMKIAAPSSPSYCTLCSNIWRVSNIFACKMWPLIPQDWTLGFTQIDVGSIVLRNSKGDRVHCYSMKHSPNVEKLVKEPMRPELLHWVWFYMAWSTFGNYYFCRRDTSLCQGYTQELLVLAYTLSWRETSWTKGFCPRKQHNGLKPNPQIRQTITSAINAVREFYCILPFNKLPIADHKLASRLVYLCHGLVHWWYHKRRQPQEVWCVFQIAYQRNR